MPADAVVQVGTMQDETHGAAAMASVSTSDGAADHHPDGSAMVPSDAAANGESRGGLLAGRAGRPSSRLGRRYRGSNQRSQVTWRWRAGTARGGTGPGQEVRKDGGARPAHPAAGAGGMSGLAGAGGRRQPASATLAGGGVGHTLCAGWLPGGARADGGGVDRPRSAGAYAAAPGIHHAVSRRRHLDGARADRRAPASRAAPHSQRIAPRGSSRWTMSRQPGAAAASPARSPAASAP